MYTKGTSKYANDTLLDRSKLGTSTRKNGTHVKVVQAFVHLMLILGTSNFLNDTIWDECKLGTLTCKNGTYVKCCSIRKQYEARWKVEIR